MGTEATAPALPDETYRRSHAEFPCFDGIRALAALMVIVYHAVFFATAFDTPGGTLLWNLNAGVWIFFVTSGFLLYRPFAAATLAGASAVDLRRYAVRRFLRIYPAYWAVLAFFTFAIDKAVIEGFDGFLVNVLLLKTYVHEENPFLIGLPPAWSLVVEVTFYAFLPLYAAIVRVLARRYEPAAVELAGVAVLGSIGIVAIVAIANGLDAPWVTVLPQHASAFALGMLLALVVVRPWNPEVSARIERLGRWPSVWWALAALCFVAMPLGLGIRPYEPMSAPQAGGLNVLQSLLGFFVVVPAVIGPQRHGAIRRLLRSRPVVFLGLVSYGLYLWHWWILGIVLGDWLGWELNRGNWVALFLVSFPVVLVAASVSWFLLERPILRAAGAGARYRHRRSVV
jgi:peptidoglycan/LPS O-acetylase OafA/YrhL